MTTTSDYIDVTVVNDSGHELGFRFPNTEEGLSLVRTLERKARREELQSVKLGKTVKGPEFPETVLPERRRGRPVDGAFEAVAPVETTEVPSEAAAEAIAKAEAEAQERIAKAIDSGDVDDPADPVSPAPAKRAATKK